MLLSDDYQNYRGPSLIKVILGNENITEEMKLKYGENNNWCGYLWTHKELFGDKCEYKNYKFEFRNDNNVIQIIQGFINDKNQYFNPPIL